jgi:hypothetical protein
LLAGERVKPEEAMAFTRSVLLKEGSAYSQMSQIPENINSVQYAITTYRVGYAVASAKQGDRYTFTGPTKGWRAESTGEQSVWPPVSHPALRREVMRRAKLLQPIVIAEPIDEMNNLRVYYLPTLIGHDGRKYTEDPIAIAFFIHPVTGSRMTVLLRAGRTYGSVNRALSATSRVYVQSTTRQSAGPLGLADAYIPNIFYAKSVEMDVEPFAEGDNFDRLMGAALEAHSKGPLATDDFRALYHEFTRYTGGPIPKAAD